MICENKLGMEGKDKKLPEPTFWVTGKNFVSCKQNHFFHKVTGKHMFLTFPIK